jgi:hypothetical protein
LSKLIKIIQIKIRKRVKIIMSRVKLRNRVRLKNYYFLFYIGDSKTHKGHQMIGSGRYKSLKEAAISGVNTFIVPLDAQYNHKLMVQDWNKATDYVCPNCGKVHDVLLDHDNNLIYGEMKGLFDDGKQECSLKIAKTLNDENTTRMNQSMERE